MIMIIMKGRAGICANLRLNDNKRLAIDGFPSS